MILRYPLVIKHGNGTSINKMEGLLGKSSDKVFSTAGFGYQRINKIFGYILFFDILCFLNFLVLPFRRKEKSAVNSTLD